MSAINPAGFATPNGNQFPTPMANYVSDRERLPDPRSRPGGATMGALDYHASPRGGVAPVWGDVYNVNVPSQPNIHTYSPMFHAPIQPRFPPPPGHPHKYPRGAFPAGRTGVPYGSVAYVGANSPHGPQYDLRELKDDGAGVVFADQIKAFSDLSLGT